MERLNFEYSDEYYIAGLCISNKQRLATSAFLYFKCPDILNLNLWFTLLCLNILNFEILIYPFSNISI